MTAWKQFERDAANYATARLQSMGVDATVTRQASSGLPEDQGDLFGIPFSAVQCKATRNIDLTVIDEAEKQAQRKRVPIGVLLQKRRMKPIGRCYVAMSYDTYLDIVAQLARDVQKGSE